MRNTIRAMMALLALGGSAALMAQAAQAVQSEQPAQTAQSTAAAPSVEEIVAKHIEAVGGKQAMSQVKSISMETDVSVMGNDSPGNTVILDGVGYKSETDFNGAKIVQCFNDKGGWQVNPMAGMNDPTPMPDDQYQAGKEDIYVGGALYNYAEKGNKVELASHDAEGYTLKVTTKNGVETTYVIDPKTYLIKSMSRKGEMQGQEVEMTISYSDYRKTDVGYLLPYEFDVDFGGQFQLSIAIKKVELNKTIDPAIFEMPKAAPSAAS